MSFPYQKTTLFKSIIHFGFQERRLQYMEKEQIKEWQTQRYGERILEIDLPLSFGLLEAVNSPTNINQCEFVWDSNVDVSVFLKVNCISTEFTPKKHGGEKGVPFRIIIDTYAHNQPSEKIHSASCQVKIFKPKGADRKHKTDREKMKRYRDKRNITHNYTSPISSGCSPQNSPLECILESSQKDCFEGSHATSPTENQDNSDDSCGKFSALSYDSSVDECAMWLQRNMFSSYVKEFVNFNGADILNLTRADLIDICGTANGIRLYNTLHSKGNIELFFRLPSTQAYSAIYLKTPTLKELAPKIKLFCGLPVDSSCDFYVSGPAGARVVLTDEVVSNMQPESLFTVERIDGSCDERLSVVLEKQRAE
ncbi:hypothetical protein JTE90_015845 [Oedothorax gibbosus]|nr:hypothetical protein JTE90_015845 [Oedothorax gibbosus]